MWYLQSRCQTSQDIQCGLGIHTTVTIRFRLYVVGSWNEQSFWVKVGGVNIFEYTLGISDTYEDLEMTFDHIDDTIDLLIGSTAMSSKGQRQGIEWGINNLGIYANPCQQKFFMFADTGCQRTSGHSTFYDIVQARDIASGVNIPSWINTKMSGFSGIVDDSETYSFLKDKKLEVIRGAYGEPEFVDMDLDERLRKLIKSTPVDGDNGQVSLLSFLSGRSSTQIIGDSESNTLTSYGKGYHNLFGDSYTAEKISSFDFSFGVMEGWACVGMIETADVAGLPLNENIRDKSMVLCSDEESNLNTNLIVKIDEQHKQVVINDANFENRSSSFKFDRIENLHYTVLCNGKGSVKIHNASA